MKPEMSCKPNTSLPSGAASVNQSFTRRSTEPARYQRNVPSFLQVVKFGGTSIGDAHCIQKVIDIIRSYAGKGELVVVVSAMAGVTNKLIEAAAESAAQHREKAACILAALRTKHDLAVHTLLPSTPERNRIDRRIRELFEECEGWCENIAQTGNLTPQIRDLISSLGERLSAPMVAAALTAQGVPSEPIEATELVVTDDYYGSADPKMELTQERCEERLRPLLRCGVIPIVTGFIGATEDGVLTTLGRGGSDYSATIIGAALGADEVTIWTDVDGILTADPHLVPAARTIPEISYREAAELAHFGAKVLHPKTLRPVVQSGIPVWIRNTFAPEKSGTKITPGGHSNAVGVKGLAAVNDAALITLSGHDLSCVPDVISRTKATAASIRTEVLMICHSPACNHVCLVVAAAAAPQIVDALRREFASEARHGAGHDVTVDSTVAVLTLVGQDLHVARSVVGRAVDELNRENVNILATAQGSSECNVSFVVPRKDVKTALATTHREFQLCLLNVPSECGAEVQAL